jgi:hypothetical protein
MLYYNLGPATVQSSYDEPEQYVPLTIKQIVDRATLDSDQLHYLYDVVLHQLSTATGKTVILPAPMGSGKSHTLFNATIFGAIHDEPDLRLVLIVNPREELKSSVSDNLKYFSDKQLVCVDGSEKYIAVDNQENFADRLRALSRVRAAKRDDPTEVVIASVSIQWLTNHYNDILKLFTYGLVMYDEVHVGLKIASKNSIWEDSGLYPSKAFKQKWVPIMNEFATSGWKCLGITATPSASHQGLTIDGLQKFEVITDVMPKRREKNCFPKMHWFETLEDVYNGYKEFWSKHLTETEKLISSIDADTWDKAKEIKIFPKMPISLVKAGSINASNSISLWSNRQGYFGYNKNATLVNDLKAYSRALGKPNMFAVNSSECKYFEKLKNSYYITKHGYQLSDVIDEFNDDTNALHSAILPVINTGIVGVNIPRLTTLAYLSDPKNPGEIVDSQIQTLGRLNRFIVSGMRSHEEMRDQINSLDISVSQKIALCQYMVHFSTNHIFAIDTELMHNAVFEYVEDTFTPDEGLSYYIGAMTAHSPTFKKPHFSMGFNPGSLNQQYKKDYCEHCTRLGLVNEHGVTYCKILGRVLSEDIAKCKFSDEEFEQLWKKALKLDHINSRRDDNRPENHCTRCGISDALKTLICKDYLTSYK